MASLKLSSLQSIVTVSYILYMAPPTCITTSCWKRSFSFCLLPAACQFITAILWGWIFRVSPARPFNTDVHSCDSVIFFFYDNKKLTAAKQSFWEKPWGILACLWRETLISLASPPNLREKEGDQSSQTHSELLTGEEAAGRRMIWGKTHKRKFWGSSSEQKLFVLFHEDQLKKS